jgi:hypothetical protein
MWESARRSWTYSLLEIEEAPTFLFFINLCLFTFGDDHHYSVMTTMTRSLIEDFQQTRFVDVINRVNLSHKASEIGKLHTSQKLDFSLSIDAEDRGRQIYKLCIL